MKLIFRCILIESISFTQRGIESMVWSALFFGFSLLLELPQIGLLFDPDKYHEILVLRYPLGIADRKLNRNIEPDRFKKLTLAVLVSRLVSNRDVNWTSHFDC
jgi:hypothetical protein